MTKMSDRAEWPSDSPRGRPTVPPHGRPSDRIDLTTPVWRGAFKAAGKHSARVRVLRWGLAGGAACAIAVILILALFDPFRRLPRNISIGEVSVQGTRITVATPKITGVQADGRPYEVKAGSGVQDTTTPSILELLDIDAQIGMLDASTVLVTASHGVYDGSQQKMVLQGEVRIWNKIGYDIRATKTTIDFQSGALGSNEPVNVILDGGMVSANQMDIQDNGHKISFEGAVKSIFDQASANARSEDAALDN
ncbi:LPS export ABC transporter periplasmic protein LptC [Methylocapsa acidiphila]|uniref:LPS export ABC transporter periplasmic protein LptC n=1 Tax=Methylocapsa acidiphila TaxID=133552 RepID=UPI00040D4F7E|nr:LPS export ABC transporter periplasmic protein LptC [Methylocapsa acidiphila]